MKIYDIHMCIYLYIYTYIHIDIDKNYDVSLCFDIYIHIYSFRNIYPAISTSTFLYMYIYLCKTLCVRFECIKKAFSRAPMYSKSKLYCWYRLTYTLNRKARPSSGILIDPAGRRSSLRNQRTQFVDQSVMILDPL